MIKDESFVLLRKLNQIQQDNADGRDRRNKSVATTCNEEEISFEQVFYFFFFFDAVFIINKSSFILFFISF